MHSSLTAFQQYILKKTTTPSTKLAPSLVLLQMTLCEPVLWNTRGNRCDELLTLQTQLSGVAVSKGYQPGGQPCVLLGCSGYTPVQEGQLAGALLVLYCAWQWRMPYISCWHGPQQNFQHSRELDFLLRTQFQHGSLGGRSYHHGVSVSSKVPFCFLC